MAFPPLGNSDHVAVSDSVDFPINSKQNAPCHRIAYDYSWADWEGLCDHFRDIPWEDIFKLSASTAAKGFCDWAQVGIYVYIPHCKCQVKPFSSSWFSAACAAAIAHRYHFFFFVCTSRINLLSFKVTIRQTSNRCKGFLEATKLPYATETKEAITSQTLGS